MSVVVDASMSLSWCFHDEKNDISDRVLEDVIAKGALVPSHWYLEIANGLQSAIRRKRIKHEFRDETLQDLCELGILADTQTSENAWKQSLVLCDRHSLTIYDAAYLELALRMNLPIATFDAVLAQAAVHEGLKVVPAIV